MGVFRRAVGMLHSLSRRLFALVVAALGIAVLGTVAAGFFILVTSDLNEYRDDIARQVRDLTGRNLVLAGDIRLSLSLSPTVVVSDVTLANAPWGSRPHMVSASRAEARIGLVSLLLGKVALKRLVLIDATVLIETDSRGRSNWSFEASDGPSDMSDSMVEVSALEEIIMTNARLTYIDGVGDTTSELIVEELSARADGAWRPISVELAGAYNGVDFEFSGELGAPADLTGDEPYPVSLQGELGDFHLSFAGLIDRPLAPRGVKLDIEVRSGGSVVSGAVTIDLTGKRPHVAVQAETAMMDIGLGGSDGGTSGAADVLVFDDAPLPFGILKAIDGTFTLRGDRVRLLGTTFENVQLDAVLAGGKLDLRLVNDASAGPALSGDFVIDLRKTTPALRARFNLRRFDMGRLLADMEITDLLEGRSEISIDVRGRGTSAHAIAAGLNGRVGLTIGKGRIGSANVDFLAADLLRLIGPWASDDDSTAFNCIVGRFDIVDGLATGETLLFDTERMVMTGKGEIDLGKEEIDLILKPQPKDASLFSLATPIRIDGALGDPNVAPDTLSVAATAAGAILGAIATGGIGLIAPFLNAGVGDNDACAAARGGSEYAARKDAGKAEKRKKVRVGVVNGGDDVFGR